jgi:hypothetical protein
MKQSDSHSLSSTGSKKRTQDDQATLKPRQVSTLPTVQRSGKGRMLDVSFLV